MQLLSPQILKESNTNAQWSRQEVVEKVSDFENEGGQMSQRAWAEKAQVPRTTLRHWLNRKETIDSSAQVRDFFESPDGLAFLHRLLIAVHFVFTKVGVASIHNISEFLKLSGLSAFVGSSYGSQQKMSDLMDQLCVEFSNKATEELSAEMPLKRVTICEDETFHPEICMVAMEPVSNYIFVEKYVQDRKGETWNEVLAEALDGLSIQLIQSTSDEGSGLLNHVKNGLQIHHSPDLFHVSYEITKGTSWPLSAKASQAEKECLKKEELLQKALLKKEKATLKKPGASKGYLKLFDQTIEQISKNLEQAKRNLQQAQTNQSLVVEMRRNISKAYHPYHLKTGNRQNEEEVENQLQECFEQIKKASNALSQKCQKQIDKAFRVVEKMKATIAFFFCLIEGIVEDCDLSPDLKKLMLEYAIPGFYLMQAASKEKDPDERHLIYQKAQALLKHFRERSSPFNEDPKRRLFLEKTAKQCAQIFQRSSSCVEGRNAQLALRHQGIHRLSNRKLKAMTAVHNFHLLRKDGTTAAERFFEQKHENLFEWLLDKMELPVRPRCRI